MPSALAEEDVITTPRQLDLAYRAHHGMVFRTAYRITGNAADAEDVLQTVFLRLLRREPAHALKNEESYLRRAAINAALDIVRARQAAGTVDLVEVASDRREHLLDLRQALARAMTQLSPRSAEVFALRFLEGLKNAEIAEMMGISRVLVAVIAHRARQRLRKALRLYLGDRS